MWRSTVNMARAQHPPFRSFQNSFGLEETGEVDRETWDALESSVEFRETQVQEPSMA